MKYCLATINSNQWHRAYIKIINEDSITVNMFDIGLITDVSYEQVIHFFNIIMFSIVFLNFLFIFYYNCYLFG